MADLTGMMQAAAGAAGGDNLFIEDVFSCFLYTGTGAALTITNNIDLDGEGGLVWIKRRDSGSTPPNNANDHILFDTARGQNVISSNTTAGQYDQSAGFTPLTTGFSLSTTPSSAPNATGASLVSWTFRKAPKFFDVVTYTGTGANRTVAHNLGSVPGSIWVKRTNTTGNWQVYHRANTAAPETDFLVLNSTAVSVDSNTRWNDTLPTDTVFTVGTEATVNASGGTYVAYLWAHDDGGFGDDGSENAVTCGGFTADGSGNATVSLGYEPQWILVRRTSSTSDWQIVDTMRGWPVNTDGTLVKELAANTSAAETNSFAYSPNATGFSLTGVGASNTFIFIAIRRGPMKTPTAGTEVFIPIVYTGNGSTTTGQLLTTGFPVDMGITRYNLAGGGDWDIDNKLSGITSIGVANNSRYLNPHNANSEASGGYLFRSDNISIRGYGHSAPNIQESYLFGRAPGFFDQVCYTGTGANRTVAHNLGVVPELMIMKKRSATDDWAVYAGDNTDFLQLNTTAATADDNTYWNDTSPTSTVFSVGTNADVNTSAATYVAFLFASLAGISDVGTYTGNGTSLTVTTGFQARFILIKRINSTGNWIIGDSARGLVAADESAVFLNSTAAETTGQDWVDVSATGFTVNETALNANVSTGTYLYLAIS